MSERISIHEAAEILNIPDQSLRLWLQSGRCPFGDAFPGRGKGYIYYINTERLNAWITASDIKSARQ